MPPKAELSESKGLLDDMWKKMREDPALDKYFIVLKGENKVIGIIGTNRWSEQGMEMGYCVNIHYWGKGYATEALKAFLDLFWSLPGKLFSSALKLNIEALTDI
jgi:RimJ/RimL family protein N-acetyltransferase